MNVSKHRISLREYLSILCGRIQFHEARSKHSADSARLVRDVRGKGGRLKWSSITGSVYGSSQKRAGRLTSILAWKQRRAIYRKRGNNCTVNKLRFAGFLQCYKILLFKDCGLQQYNTFMSRAFLQVRPFALASLHRDASPP